MALAYDTYPLVLQVLDKLSQGTTETVACNGVGISVRDFRRAVAADIELQASYAEAQVLGNDALADGLLNPETGVYGSTDPKKMKIYSDNIKWLLGKRDNKRYGEKLEIKQETTVAFVITDQLERARVRSQQGLLVSSAPADYIDASYTMVDEEAEAEEFMKQFATS